MLAGAGRSARAAADPVRIGELNSYTQFPAFLEPYRRGWQLALEQVNATGGVLGRALEVVSRDDGGTPADAVRVAEELLAREQVVMLFGGFASHVGLAVSDLALRRRRVFLAAEPLTDKLVWEQGHRYTFRLRASTWMQTAMLVPEAAKLGRTRWALVAPDYEYGQAAIAAFKALMTRAQPDATVVVEQLVPLGRIDAGPVAQALASARPDAIFSALFGPDLARFVREGRNRGLFRDRAVVNLLAGEPEYLEPLKAEAPEGWLVTGYPGRAVATPEHARFRDAYVARWGGEEPKLGSVVGHAALHSVAAALRRAGATDAERIADAFAGLPVDTPFGRIVYRAGDHQSTLGAFVGRLALRDGRGTMVDWVYRDGAAVLPPEAEAAKRRPAR
ncbi:MAG: ABC transporter substrate-binding protein [Burkholderiales bacterium]|nr:ABC transporter substrate-binding protein [Burkholderiales bacterium]